jgi:hypothetical protein
MTYGIRLELSSFPVMKFRRLILCLFCACLFARGQELEPASREMRTRLYWLAPDDLTHGAKALPQRIADSPWNAQFDMREYLAGKGVKLEADEEAIYQPAPRVLVVRATRKTLEAVDALRFLGCAGNAPSNLRVEAELVEFSAGTAPEFTVELPLAELRKAAGDSWRVLNRVQVRTRPGERTLVVSKTGSNAPEPKDAPSATDQPQSSEEFGHLSKGEFGATLEVEPTLDPDGGFAQVNMVYACRAGETPTVEWNTRVTTIVKTGSPKVIQMSSATPGADGTQPAKIRALILRVDAIYAGKGDPQSVKQPIFPAARPTVAP